jgi:predicted Rossmann fold nucleotide-binding protein DprA/Smf involved in DNA uptake
MNNEILLPLDPLVRNKVIVNISDVILATPFEDKEVMRSGTWSTIRYARKVGKTPIIILP